MVWFSTLARQFCQSPVEHADATPADEPIVDRLGWTIVGRRQPVADHEDIASGFVQAFVYGVHMRNVRVLLTANSRLTLLLIVLALFAKALIPTGYMIGNASKVLTVQLCLDGSGATKSTTIEIPIGKRSPAQSNSHGKTDGTCAFSSLSMASMAAVDPVLLDFALAFILLLGFAALESPRLRAITHLRPPLRGPPAAA